MSLYSPSIIITGSEEQLERLTEIRDKLIVSPATEATLAEVSARIQELITELQLKANGNEAQPITGIVAVSNFPASQSFDGDVTVTNFPTTQAISGTVAVSNQPTDLATATLQTTQIARLEQIRDFLGDIRTYTDSLELLLTSLNGYVDGLETLLGTANTTQSAIAGFVDQLEGYTDGLEGNQATQILLETAIRDRLNSVDFATQTTLAAILAKLIAAPATEANQTTQTARLETIATNQPKSKGAGVVDAETQRFTLASDGTFAQAFGAKTDEAASSNTASTGFISLFKRLLGLIPAALSSTGRFQVDSSISGFQDASLIAETALTAVGSTTARSAAGYKYLTYQVDVTGVGVNVVVRMEGNLTGNSYDNLNTSNLDTTLTANKTYIFQHEGKLNNVRFSLISFSGGTPSLTCYLLRGN
jgi:hypothetical protein